MIVKFPFQFSASVVPHGKRKGIPTDLRSHVYVEVRETTGEDAPIVVWFSRNRDVHVAYRHFEGAFYEPVIQDREYHSGTSRKGRPRYDRADPASAVRTADDFDDEIATLSRKGVEDALSRGARGFDSDSEACDMDLPEIESFDAKEISAPNEAIAANLQASFAAILVVDGVCYRRTHCPAYRVETDVGRIEPASMDPRHFGSKCGVYRVDRYEDAISAWRESLIERGRWTESAERAWNDGRDIYELPHPPDVLRPDLLPDDERRFVVLGTAEDVLGSLRQNDRSGWRSGPRVAHYPRDVIMAFGGLRDAVDGGDETEVLDALSVMGEAVRPHGTLSRIENQVDFLLKRVRAEDAGIEVVP